MKRRILCPICLLLTMLLLSQVLVGCSKKKAYFTYKDSTLSEAAYRYILSDAKYNFVTTYEDIVDTDECWNRKITASDGSEVTIGEYVERYAQQYARNVVCELQLFKEKGLKLGDEAIEAIDQSISETVRYKYDDSKSKFNEALKSGYGITLNDLREIMIIQSKAQLLESTLTSDGGELEATDADLAEFYKSNYVRVFVLVVTTECEYVLGEDGKPKKNDLGFYETVTYTDEEKAERRALADSLWKRAEAGESYGTLSAEHNDLHIDGKDNGFYFSSRDLEGLIGAGYDSAILASIFAQEKGKPCLYEDGDVYIVWREELEEDAYKLPGYASFFTDLQKTVTTEKFRVMLDEMGKDVTVSDDVYKLKTVDVNKSNF